MNGWQHLVRDLAHRIEHDVIAVLDRLDPAMLDLAVAPGTNTIGWLVWHLTRSHDRNVSELRSTEQLWLADGWHERFGRAADQHETGFQHTPAEVAASCAAVVELVEGLEHVGQAALVRGILERTG